MFGSNFFANFGIPDFPFQGADAQGGYLASNLPTPGDDPSQNAAPPAATPPTAPQQPGTGSSPLAPGPLGIGGGSPQQTPPQPDVAGSAPAAGVGSQFGKPANG